LSAFAEYARDLLDKDPKELPFTGRLAMFQMIRKRIHDLAEELDLSGSNMQYHLKNEPDFRKRVQELSLLVRKLEEVLGPESQPANVT